MKTLLIALLMIGVAPAAEKPNIVFILADDLGWADTTLYGHTKLYQTPNIERLAKRGMTFTRAYSASPLCSPTRSSILTGLNPARTGLTTPNCHTPPVVLQAIEGVKAPPNKKSIGPKSVSRLDPEYHTLAEALKGNGYATGHFGKWHLGKEPYSPLEHGFDIDVPHWHGPGPAGSFVAPWEYPDFDPDTPDQHIEDRMAKEAVQFIEQHKDKPFFLNYWMFSVHAPFDAKDDLIEKYRSRIDPKAPQRSPTYAAMVESMDDAVGALMDTLDKNGLTENTILVFFSDNGGNMYNNVDDTTPTSNAPLRGGKASMFEGGIRVPMIVAWPGNVEPNTRSDSRVHSDDFYPTILDMLKLQPQEGQIFDGVSFLPALEGKSHSRRPSFTYFPHDPPVPDWIPPSVAVHEGDWKLIRIFHGGEQGAHRWKLYNLRDDIGESNNLAAKEPERVREMDALIEDFLTETKAVRPILNPKFDPAKYDPSKEGVGKERAKSVPPRRKKPDTQTNAPTAPDKPNIILIYTDDHGWPDIGPAGIHQDLKTPHLNALAAAGVHATNGYSSAPQCVPSRAGLMTGKYQNRFDVESNGKDLAGFNKELTVAERLKKVGYTTGQIGKWHLGPGNKINEHGFDYFYNKNANRRVYGNFNKKGEKIATSLIPHTDYHIDACSKAALVFLRAQKDNPFFLYLAYRAPHVPLDAPKRHLDRFPGKMPERRRQALAMIAAMDDGVGAIVAELKELSLTKKTLIFYIGDNGAPLKIHKVDAPGGGPGWDGSLNEPLNGEKGMLTEGGIRVPFLISWPGTIPSGQIYEQPIIALDATATALHLAGTSDVQGIDGANILPHLTGQSSTAPHQALYWRWVGQSAVRQDDWKLLRGDERSYLFNLAKDKEEKHNLITQHPDIATKLGSLLDTWDATLPAPTASKLSKAGSNYFDWYLDGKRDAKPPKQRAAKTKMASRPEQKIFQQRDKNKDGKVTLDEFIAGRTGEVISVLKKNFKRRDTDKNGVWEKSEID